MWVQIDTTISQYRETENVRFYFPHTLSVCFRTN